MLHKSRDTNVVKRLRAKLITVFLAFDEPNLTRESEDRIRKLRTARYTESKFRQKSLFKAMCYKCGTLLWGKLNSRRYWRDESETPAQEVANPPVERLFQHGNFKKGLPLPYKAVHHGQTKLHTCVLCHKGRNVSQYFTTDSQGKIQQPEVFKDMNAIEKGMCALVHVFSRTFSQASIPGILV